MTHETDTALFAEIDAHMRKMWAAYLLPADCWPVGLAKRVSEAARRAPAEFDDETWSMLVAKHTHQGACNFRNAAAELVTTAAAPQPPGADHIPDAGKMVAAPVQMPEPANLMDAVEAYANASVEYAHQGDSRAYKEMLAKRESVRDLLAAQARKPLEDKEIENLAAPFTYTLEHKIQAIEDDGSIEGFARAIERAHGITGGMA